MTVTKRLIKRIIIFILLLVLLLVIAVPMAKEQMRNRYEEMNRIETTAEQEMADNE